MTWQELEKVAEALEYSDELDQIKEEAIEFFRKYGNTREYIDDILKGYRNIFYIVDACSAIPDGLGTFLAARMINSHLLDKFMDEEAIRISFDWDIKCFSNAKIECELCELDTGNLYSCISNYLSLMKRENSRLEEGFYEKGN